jgi:hypothetical protein
LKTGEKGGAPDAPTSAYRHNRTGVFRIPDSSQVTRLPSRSLGEDWSFSFPWEQIFYCEFDGRRRKRALVKIVDE